MNYSLKVKWHDVANELVICAGSHFINTKKDLWIDKLLNGRFVEGLNGEMLDFQYLVRSSYIVLH